MRTPWLTIVRLGLVQAAIGAVVVLMTTTLNRVMVVELGLAATVPGILVALHFAVQLWLRPRFGHASDGARRTPWIAGGLVLLALSGTLAAVATAWIATSRGPGLALAALAFMALGAGVSAAGTPLLALLAELVPEQARARAAATVWLMMIAGFIVTTVVASLLLEPFSYGALVRAVGSVALVALVIALLALARLEPAIASRAPAVRPVRPPFRPALAAVWADRPARAFALFIFVSMLAYSAQDLILEPFAGVVFGLTPAESTRVSSMHQGGMLLGMLACAALAMRLGGLRAWAAGGCVLSAIALLVLVFSSGVGGLALFRPAVVLLGLANGAFAIGAIGAMMALSVAEGGGAAGVRMGVFGAAQAVAYALGGSLGAAGSDVARAVLGSAAGGYAAVFTAEAMLFVVAAVLALRAVPRPVARRAYSHPASGDPLLAQLG